MAIGNRHLIVDATKVLLAVLIVAHHSQPLFNGDTVNICVAATTNIAVPLFFCFSGYFYHIGKILHFIKRVLILYLFWFPLHVPLLKPMFENLSGSQIFRHVIFSGTYSVSWFLITLIWSALLLEIVKDKRYLYIPIGIFLYSMCVSCFGWYYYFEGSWMESIKDIYSIPFLDIRYSLPQGFIFFVIGHDLKKHGQHGTLFFSAVSILSACLYAGEIIFVKERVYSRGTEALFSLPLLAYGLAGLCLRCHWGVSSDKTVYAGRLLRNISTLLYLSHPLLMAILFKLFAFQNLNRFVFTLLMFIPLCLFYFFLREKRGFHWIKYAC